MNSDKIITSLQAEDKKSEKELSKMSPFEIKNELIELAQIDAKKSTRTFLNAGRGNPNWIATEPRSAFFLLGEWALAECMHTSYNPIGIAGIPRHDGLAKNFLKFLKDNNDRAGAKLLAATFHYMIKNHKADPDDLALEWAEGIIGDQYPSPDRILKYTELIVRDYLAREMGDGADPDTPAYDLFATEGGTAAMCYIFDSLAANHLVKKGDRIAIITPIFTPYLEIPELDRFDFDVVKVSANKSEQDGLHTWQYTDAELDKLRDPSIKLLCLVNPSNPPSYALSKQVTDRIIDIVKHDNPNLMIVTDDVYGTFIDHFKSLMYELPENTLCVYSFSKYFGATGWRLAVIAAARHNIFDKLISALPADERKDLNRRYATLSLNPENIKFIDRMVADSRMVALNHTAGLSTPQQIQMTLFAAFTLLDEKNIYKARMHKIITDRLNTLWDKTGFTLLPDPLRAGYYSEIDIMVWANKFYGKEFADYLNKNYEPLDFVIRLANETSVVLLNGDGFDGPKWSVRASLANLDKEEYAKIGKSIRCILDTYYQRFKEQKK